MSAWVVTHTHINKIINYAKLKDMVVYVDGARYHTKEDKDCQELGQILWDENHRSVNYRYSEKSPNEKYNFSLDLSACCPYQFIQDIRCLDYQSCETEDYGDSKAYKALQSMMWQAACIVADIHGKNLKWGRQDAENKTAKQIAPGFFVLEN